MTRDERFDALLESDAEPERAEFGRTLPFTKARVALEDIYRLSQDAEKPAAMLLAAARSGPDELAAALRALDGKPWRGFALLYAAQKGTALVMESPRRATALATAIEDAAATLVESDPADRASTPAPRQAVVAEALLLRAQAEIQDGLASEARETITRARASFRAAADFGFGAAMCDYHEGQAAVFACDYAFAETLLSNAVHTFQDFGQLPFVARAEAALGLCHANRGRPLEALEHLDRAIAAFDADVDARPLASALNNRANTLTQLGRYDEARATFARAMNLARRHGLESLLRYIRSGLAELDFRRGLFDRALRAFREIAAEAVANGSAMDVLFARLYVAECLGRTSQYDAMMREIESIREARRKSPFAPSPALGELFMCLDQGTLDADLVAHVREYLEAVENGADRPYMPLRLVG